MAVDIPDDARGALDGYLRGCAAAAPAFRWAPAANLHVTLRFCGGLEKEQVSALREELRGVRAEPFEMALGGVGAFGGRQPRVIYLGLAAGADALRSLAVEVEAACRQIGLEPEARPFRGHLTLARPAGRERAAMPELPPPPDLPAWRVDRFRLYESRLGRGPAVYSVLEEFPLSLTEAR